LRPVCQHKSISNKTSANDEKLFYEIEKYDPDLNPIVSITTIERDTDLRTLKMMQPSPRYYLGDGPG